MSAERYHLHETAVLEEGATVGDGAFIWHHAHVRAGSVLGDGTVLGKNVFVDAGVSIGKRCKVQNNVSVYAGVTIEDDVFVGPSVTFTNDLVPRAFNAEWTQSPTRIREGASLGANSTIVCGNEIGEFAMVAAAAVVTRDVPAHALAVGHPARIVGWVCRCGAVVSRAAERPDDVACVGCKEKGES